MSDDTLARRFNDLYESLAPTFGYETRADTKQFDPEIPNGKLMIAVCNGLLGQLLDENAALKKEAVIAEKYGLSQAAEICRDAAWVHAINGYDRGYNHACRDNYNAILKLKDKP